jgi:proline dehydrogenase
MISFENTQIAFSIKSTPELRRAGLMFRLISVPLLVRIGNTIIRFLSRIGFPVNWMVKPTIYRQFVGGETLEECVPVINRLAGAGVKSILDYSVEGKEEDEDIERALEETLRAIYFAGSNEQVPFAVFKPTAFIRSDALEELGKQEVTDPEVFAQGARFRERVERLCSAASSLDLPIMIDAEEVCYQDFIDQVVYEMQKKYNKNRAIVYNTYQMYRKDRLSVLARDLERAGNEGFFLGAKFVRGAYMERERARAAKLSYPDPIQPDKESTDRDYNAALAFSIDNLHLISIFNGTHNEYSSAYLAELMEAKGIARNDNRVWFSQLYGMSDHISFNLANLGYNVAKYVPYGPVKHVLPYLTRRAEENTSVKGQTGRELSLIKLELNRRKRFSNAK